MSKGTPRRLRAIKKEKTISTKKARIQTKEPRIGVFICHCGSKISSVIDVAALSDYAKDLPGVAYVESMDYPCSRQGQNGMAEAIKKKKLERVVVAGCSPRLYEPTFQS